MKALRHALVCLALLVGCTEDSPSDGSACGHAHNDYEHTMPFAEAFSLGFCSIEADVFWVDGLMQVAHREAQVRPERTLQSLYLDPLKRLHEESKLDRDQPLMLLVDVKTDAEATYGELDSILADYKDFLTVFENGEVKKGQVTVIISGNRAIDTMTAQTTRYAFVDGRPSDLANNPPVSLMPLVSDNLLNNTVWFGMTPLADENKQTLRALTDQAHEQGRLFRFWLIPDDELGWSTMQEVGVDLINTDDLNGLSTFLSR